MKYVLSIILVTTFYFNSFCQNDCSDILFDSELEKTLLENFSEETAFKQLFIIDNNDFNEADLNASIQEYYIFLDKVKKGIKKKKRKKAASYIYKKIHDQYFLKYIENPLFSDIFSKKEYNCVTASALFALGLKYLDIPFEIRETPIHVYLILYPNEDKILFESTTPGENVTGINAKQVEEYKKALISNKMITKEESMDDDFFNKYYLADSIISMKELVAIQYSNSSFRHGAEEEFEIAFNQLEKAYVLYPSEPIKFSLNIYLLGILNNTDAKYTNKEYCDYYSKIVKYNAELEGIEGEFGALYFEKVNQLIKKENNIDSIENISNCLTSKITNDSINWIINDIAYRAIAEFYYNSIEYDKALKALMKVYTPKDKSFNLAIKECVGRKLYDIRDPKNAMDSLSHYAAIFPFMLKDRDFQGYKAFCQLKLVYSYFSVDEFDEGIVYFQQFKDEFKPTDNVAYSEGSIGSGFGAVSSYYVRKGDYKMAEQVLLEGLKFDTYNIDLKRKLKLLYSSYPELEND